jgi:EmrB/QacA subfamily drug resistance transporter
MTSAASASASAPLTHRRILVAMSGLAMVLLLAALDSTIVATALPTIVGELGGLERLAWVVTAYILAQTVVTPLYGKLGDLYGRKRILQSAILVFLLGSVLCGIAQSLIQLIVFRAIQGLGAGGLMVTTQATVGDLVSPRERGRYMGIFGAVFGMASIAGPLLGGFFTTHLTWRWIFFINVPLGALALAVLAATLPPSAARVSHSIDYLGAVCLAALLSGVVLASDIGGTGGQWTSPLVLTLLGVVVVSLIGFLATEPRAREPVMPLRLFRDETFSITSVIGFVVGFAMFGSITYVPVFLQVVQGASPTRSGLLLVPMMAGLIVASITSGQIISRTGRYKMIPVIGTGLSTLGLAILSRLAATTPTLTVGIAMILLGAGLGLVMQVLVIAVQNTAPPGDLGVATSSSMLFRLIGGSIGTAALGAIFAARVHRDLQPVAAALRGVQGGGGGAATLSPQLIARMPDALRATVTGAFAHAIDWVFLVAAVVALVGFVLCWLMPARPLRDTVHAGAREMGLEAGEAAGMVAEE